MKKIEASKEQKEAIKKAAATKEVKNLSNKLRRGSINALIVKHWWLDRLILFVPFRPCKPYEGFIVYFHKHSWVDSAKLENASKFRRLELFGEIMEVSEEKFDRQFFIEAKEKQGIKISDAFRREILYSYRLYKILERQKGKMYDFWKAELSEIVERMR